MRTINFHSSASKGHRARTRMPSRGGPASQSGRIFISPIIPPPLFSVARSGQLFWDQTSLVCGSSFSPAFELLQLRPGRILRRNPGVLGQLRGCHRRAVRERGILTSTECSWRSSTRGIALSCCSTPSTVTLAPPLSSAVCTTSMW